MDRVTGGMGRVLEVGESGTSHGGQVRVDYDNKSPARRQPTPLRRTVSGGVVVTAADELDGIRVTGVSLPSPFQNQCHYGFSALGRDTRCGS